MDLIRDILLKIEEYNEPTGWINITIAGYTDLEISYHIKLLSQAGLIEAFNGSDTAGFDWKAKSLTWEGHEFLDSARNNTIWEKTKSVIKTKALGASFEIVKEILKEITVSFIKQGVI